MTTVINIPREKTERSKFKKMMYEYHTVVVLGIIVIVNTIIAIVLALIFEGGVKGIMVGIIGLLMVEGLLMMMSVLNGKMKRK